MTGECILATGMGVISALGDSVAETEVAFLRPAGSPVLSPFADHGLSVPVFRAGNVAHRGDESRTVALSRHAAEEALAQARIEPFANPARVGICVGTTVASQINDIPFYENLRRNNIVDRAAVTRYRNSNVAEALARALGTTGPRLTVCNACSSGADAIGTARSWLRAGLCDIAIAGGADELSRLPLCGFRALGVYSEEHCRPFDRDRSGLNIGEAAGVLILETERHAVARGATALCELAGYGAANDAHHLTAPHPDGDGLFRAIHCALREASVIPSDIAFVNAHGTATPDNDRIEGRVLARVFGRHVPVVSTKGWTGHALGAAGAIEAIFTVMGIRAERIPGTAGLRTRDPDIPVHVSPEPQAVAGDFAISTSLAFGGCNAALVFKRGGG